MFVGRGVFPGGVVGAGAGVIGVGGVVVVEGAGEVIEAPLLGFPFFFTIL